MAFVKVLNGWMRNNELTDYPQIPIYSTASKLGSSISSKSEFRGKCVAILVIILLNFKYLFRSLDVSLDSGFDVEFKIFIDCLCELGMHFLLYFKFNLNFLRQIENLWKELQIDSDYAAKKYFWNHKVIYYILSANFSVSLLIYDIANMFRIWPYSDAGQSTTISIYRKNPIHYWTIIVRIIIIHPYNLLQTFILFDLLVLAQTALQHVNMESHRLYRASNIDIKTLNIKAMRNLRLKFFSTQRLVNKMNEFFSPFLFPYCVIFMNRFINLLYFGLFVQQSLGTKIYRTVGCVGMLSLLILVVHAAVKVYTKSQEVMVTVYKLSLKTDYLRVMNEISLFLNCGGIGFSFGGIFMINTSTVFTFFSILATIIVSIPSFTR
ncbi:uncharacterized protein LOC107368511 isoform X2 [Tetranychus urticae]|uniref:Gustatory receptor n=1 Tax=Tetranychus urticae TaxID=32264 RepID=T1KYT4_TETUR|nr:uncharacterized protein LOC107368511 isoform X2 [Tetranychus urticae]